MMQKRQQLVLMAEQSFQEAFASIEDACDLWRGQLHVELQLYAAVKQQLDEITTKLDAIQKEQSAVNLLQTVPGVGPRTAEALVAVIDDPHRFKSCGQV